jgi:4-methoxybenzoate monooxygenase (O-demethylating)
LGFGYGIHQCLGQMMARMEAEVLLEALVPRVKSIRLTGEPVRRINNTLHALASLPIEIEV